MLICESCGAVFAFPASQMDNETGCVEEFCPECHSRYIMKAASCQVCGGWVAEDDAFGYGGSTVCDECLNAASSDLDLLYAATKDECEDFELPVLFRTFFTDDEIREILMRELKNCHDQIPRDTKAFVRRYANEIAEEMVKEDQKPKELPTIGLPYDRFSLSGLAAESIGQKGGIVPVENYERLLHFVQSREAFDHGEV